MMLQIKIMLGVNAAIFKLCEGLEMTVHYKLLLKLFEPILKGHNVLFKAAAMLESTFKNGLLTPSYGLNSSKF